MKNYYKIVIVIAIIYFLAVLGLWYFFGREDSSDSVRGRDITTLNDITINAGEYWNNLEKLNEKDYGADYVILNTENAILFSSIKTKKSDEVYSVQSAIKKGYPP